MILERVMVIEILWDETLKTFITAQTKENKMFTNILRNHDNLLVAWRHTPRKLQRAK